MRVVWIFICKGRTVFHVKQSVYMSIFANFLLTCFCCYDIIDIIERLKGGKYSGL